MHQELRTPDFKFRIRALWPWQSGRWWLALCGAAAFAASLSAQEARDGTIEFSDGATLSGKISLTPGSELKLHVGQQLRTLALDRVQEIRTAPEREEMERAWRFLEAGKTAKEFTGEPYPVLYLKTDAVLAGGEKISGHLYTTVLYVEGEERTDKVLLLAKQRGKEGEKFDAVVFPKRISFGDAAKAASATVKLKLTGLGAGAQVAALTRGPLVRLEARKSATPGEFTMPSPLGREIFLAAKTGAKITVGWPKTSDAALLAQVRAAMPDAEDFFDSRQVLGVFRDAADGAIYSLVLAARQGKTTLDETRSQPWRLEIYRWKADDDGKKLMLAGQGYFFRGIGAKDDPLPAVELSEKLWQIRRDGDTLTTGN